MAVIPAERRFYVYSYLRDDETPYYIGKGSGPRLTKCHRYVHPPKNTERVVLVAKNMCESDALQAEVLLIFMYGRIDQGTGCLRNMTNGGEGRSGPMPECHRKKISQALKGHPRCMEKGRILGLSRKGVPLTEEHKQKLSAALIGRAMSRLTRGKMSVAAKDRTTDFSGSNNGRAVLTQHSVAAIKSGSLNEKSACQAFGISRSQFYRVKRGEQWQ